MCIRDSTKVDQTTEVTMATIAYNLVLSYEMVDLISSLGKGSIDPRLVHYIKTPYSFKAPLSLCLLVDLWWAGT